MSRSPFVHYFETRVDGFVVGDIMVHVRLLENRLGNRVNYVDTRLVGIAKRWNYASDVAETRHHRSRG